MSCACAVNANPINIIADKIIFFISLFYRYKCIISC
jgi:hypothetical protein